jgi:hypothetical protein
MQRYNDMQTYAKLDDALSIEFLTAVAGVLKDQDAISSSAYTSLKGAIAMRQSISNLQSTFLSKLIESDNEFAAELSHRYQTALSRNLFRFTTQQGVTDIVQTLQGLLSVIVKKCELVFNRILYVNQNERTLKRELFAEVTTRLAKDVQRALSDLDAMRQNLQTFMEPYPVDVGDGAGVTEFKIAKQLGFSHVESHTLNTNFDRHAMERLTLELTQLTRTISDHVNYIYDNCIASEAMYELRSTCDLSYLMAQQLSACEMGRGQSLSVWEAQRSAIGFVLFNLNVLFEEMVQLYEAGVVPIAKIPLSWQLSLDVFATMEVCMTARGTLLKSAKEASGRLRDYCLAQEILPKDMIEAELKRLHPALTSTDLETIKSLTSDSLTATPGGSMAKAKIAKFLDKARAFAQTVPNLGVIFVFLSAAALGIGCGVKTGIHSDVDDLRPPVPQRNHVSQKVEMPAVESLFPDRAPQKHIDKEEKKGIN